MELTREGLRTQVNDLYQHLYDIVYLRSHSLTDRLVPGDEFRRKEKAWQVHHLLVDLIEELDPGEQAPVLSREWRRYRLMVLRYLDGLDPQAVADSLSISRRQFYREHDAAIEAIADIVWDRYFEPARAVLSSPAEAARTGKPIDLTELLRQETASLSRTGKYARLSSVIQGTLPFLSEMLNKYNIEVFCEIPEKLPDVAINQNLLRQLLLGLLSLMIEHAWKSCVRMSAKEVENMVILTIQISPSIQPGLSSGSQQERLSALVEMARLGGADLQFIEDQAGFAGYRLQLPYSHHTILVVDDNEDVLELFQRYLEPHNFQVVTACSTLEALSIVNQHIPDVITLDLMMPEKDGWDLLQILLNRPETQNIPIIVCSVLKQKELALSLGATAFLEKPVQEQVLVETIESFL